MHDVSPRSSSRNSSRDRPHLPIDSDTESSISDHSLKHATRPRHVSWLSLPNKGQLAIIVFARLAEPLSERSLTSYLFYQLQWFSPTLPDSVIAGQVGVITSAFAAAQCCTGMLWGYAADNTHLGRKTVLMIGLLGSCISAVGIGFSKSFTSAVLFRILAGTMNGNVGVLRTMIAEVVDDKRYQPRAFLLLPMCFNVGVIIGPLISGFLVDPLTSMPTVFGPDSALGGISGVGWMKSFPYALTNLVCATVLFFAAVAVYLGLEETHPSLRYRRDYGRELGRFCAQKLLCRGKPKFSYEPVRESLELDDSLHEDVESSISREAGSVRVTEERDRAPLRQMYTRVVVLSLLQNFTCAIHVSAFNTILFILLPTPRSSNSKAHLPLRFTGGLGLSVEKVAFANTAIGVVGLPLQILLFPWVSERLGVLRSYSMFLPFSILAYLLLPFLALLPEQSHIVWPCLIAVLSAQVLSRTFVGPATTVLVNESAPHPTLLGTIHGLAASSSAGARILGPSAGGALLGWGLKNNFIGAPFWLIGIIAFANLFLLWALRM